MRGRLPRVFSTLGRARSDPLPSGRYDAAKVGQQKLGNRLRPLYLYQTLLSIFGLLALSLSAVGLYGVMAYAVSQRTREMGIRISVGAQRTDVLKLILRQGLILSAIGMTAGLLTALIVTHLLYGISAADPATFAVIAAVLLGVALAASFFPARRATKIDPMIAIRTE